jgi:hypothetical protein
LQGDEADYFMKWFAILKEDLMDFCRLDHRCHTWLGVQGTPLQPREGPLHNLPVSIASILPGLNKKRKRES